MRESPFAICRVNVRSATSYNQISFPKSLCYVTLLPSDVPVPAACSSLGVETDIHDINLEGTRRKLGTLSVILGLTHCYTQTYTVEPRRNPSFLQAPDSY